MYLCLYACSIDGEITYESQMKLIRDSFDEVSNASDVVLCEGTGHCAVGSIVNVNNAKVASMLGASMLLIANGGLGEFLFSPFRLFVVIAHNGGTTISEHACFTHAVSLTVICRSTTIVMGAQDRLSTSLVSHKATGKKTFRSWWKC